MLLVSSFFSQSVSMYSVYRLNIHLYWSFVFHSLKLFVKNTFPGIILSAIIFINLFIINKLHDLSGASFSPGISDAVYLAHSRKAWL
jgi:hypothetical protein